MRWHAGCSTCRHASCPLLLVFASACTTTPTSTGQLRTVVDVPTGCDDSADNPSWACTVQIAITNNHLSAVGVFNDGIAGGPTAEATLTGPAVDQLATLISGFPLDTPDTIHSDGCGGPPARSTHFAIDFDNGDSREFSFEYSTDPDVRDLDNYILGLVTEVSTCRGDRLSIASCVPYVQGQGASLSRVQLPAVIR